MRTLIWLHEDALRLSHPVFAAAPPDAIAIHVWDDAYLRNANYSLKRLVFLYETLCELRIPIFKGDTVRTLQQHSADTLFIPESPNPFIRSAMKSLQRRKLIVVPDEPFVALEPSRDYKRFFQYWNKAERTAFLRNGGAYATHG